MKHRLATSWKALVCYKAGNKLRQRFLPVAFVSQAIACLGIPAAAAQARAPIRSLHAELVIDAAMTHLAGASSLVVHPDGRIAVIEPANRKIDLFASNGRFLSAVGGTEPVLFRSMNRSGRVGDTLWVADAASRQTVFVSEAGNVLRKVAWHGETLEPGQTDHSGMRVVNWVPRAVYDHAEMLVTASPSRRLGSSMIATADKALSLVRLSADGVIEAVVATLRIADPVACSWGTSRKEQVQVPFCAHPIIATSEDGSRTVTVEQANVLTSRGVFRVCAVGPRGDTVFTRSMPYAAVPVTRKAIADLLKGESLLRGMPRPDPADTAIFRHAPATFPPVRRILIGGDQSVWLEVRYAGGGHQWLMLDRAGTLTGTLEVPDDVTLESASLSTVWALRANGSVRGQDIVRYAVR